MNFETTGGFAARSRIHGVVGRWSDEEWSALPPDRRPRGVIRFGSGWVHLAADGPSDGGRARQGPPESITVDPSSPAVREFLLAATLEGLIRTAAAGPGRVVILPSGRWSRVGRPPEGGPRPAGDEGDPGASRMPGHRPDDDAELRTRSAELRAQSAGLQAITAILREQSGPRRARDGYGQSHR
jgi:hypothetical protein